MKVTNKYETITIEFRAIQLRGKDQLPLQVCT